MIDTEQMTVPPATVVDAMFAIRTVITLTVEAGGPGTAIRDADKPLTTLTIGLSPISTPAKATVVSAMVFSETVPG